MPKRGRALIWPSIQNENPHQKDPRTDHEAMPVIKGVKYGANAWQHIRDFKEPFRRVRFGRFISADSTNGWLDCC